MSGRHGWRAVLPTALPALAAGGLLAGFGVLDPVHAALVVVVVAAVVHVWRALDEGTEPPWPAVPDDRRDGARTDVSELGWATFTRSGAVGDRMRRRVVALASSRLAEHGVDLDDDARRDAAARLLGADVVAGLTAGRPASRVEVHRWLDAVERLHAPSPRAPDPDERTPA
ncbi:hypothetical protein GCM10009809_33740 [Isoptericola hypogeus]|uniref:Uncharacterized protein n=1 Tax=Isoptericola hypogeus TaxID=300179 RepID=A0ABP4VRL3_9MICO